ncbi:hypothetical protein [Chitinophaga filiformis]|uniref:Uncharacterized protein n=1 Tax=Chitinophaga filiformis TaxID=104663 RepID=A0ABY4HW52_CHIFI|nr:hypothetical protein [Chitinophaga filiformis]UPK68016.1 hypothetical protein MYF79_23980 [Chitinophaga filiformis]
MELRRFEHLIPLARQAYPDCHYRGRQLAEILLNGYASELQQDLSQLFQTAVVAVCTPVQQMIDDYCRRYERYLQDWLSLQQDSTAAGMKAGPTAGTAAPDPAYTLYLQWRHWRGLQLYQLKKYCRSLTYAHSCLTNESDDQQNRLISTSNQ